MGWQGGRHTRILLLLLAPGCVYEPRRATSGSGTRRGQLATTGWRSRGRLDQAAAGCAGRIVRCFAPSFYHTPDCIRTTSDQRANV